MVTETRKKEKTAVTIIIVSAVLSLILFSYIQIIRFLNPPMPFNEPSRNDAFYYMLLESEPLNNRRSPIDVQNLEITFISIADETHYHGTPGILAWPGASQAEFRESIQGIGFFGNMNFNAPQDVFSIELSNGYPFDVDLLVKLFYNYIEIPFRIVGEEEYRTDFVITLASLYDAHIPIQLYSGLESNDYINKLTLVTHFLPDRHMAELPEFNHIVSAMGLNFDINHYNKYMLDLTPNFSDIYILTNLQTGFMINTDVLEPLNNGSSYFPPIVLEASANEIMDLAFHINPHSLLTLVDIYDYIIISLLDFDQIEMSGKPFLHVEASEDRSIGHHGTFTIIAPDELGMYEFTAFVVMNPTQPMSYRSFFPLDFSTRFTIKVVE